MRDWIEIGPVPCEEECEQLGPNYNPAKARAECQRFILAIRKVLGPEPEGASLRIRSNPHDFGTYLEVACYYDDSIPASVEYAFECESKAPQTWPEGV